MRAWKSRGVGWLNLAEVQNSFSKRRKGKGVSSQQGQADGEASQCGEQVRRCVVIQHESRCGAAKGGESHAHDEDEEDDGRQERAGHHLVEARHRVVLQLRQKLWRVVVRDVALGEGARDRTHA